MSDSPVKTELVQHWIDRLQAGDQSARDALLNCASDRLLRIARKMSRSYPRLKRWEETGDVLQGAVIRLHRALGTVEVEDPRHFFRLAALQIRRELLDLQRRYDGAHGLAANHATLPRGERDDSQPPSPLEQGTRLHGPDQMAQWAEFHQAIEELPEEHRELFDLLWYQKLTTGEAAEVLGISERHVNRRWTKAKLKLHDLLEGEPPPF
ncbi:MAG: sigma-70 family RNA polymerase sigma factor [Pirellulaceae bacterium]